MTRLLTRERERSGGRYVSWAEFLAWAASRTLAEASDPPGEPSTTVLRFTDGSVAHVQSNFDGPWSDVTPGDGIQPPTVCLFEAL